MHTLVKAPPYCGIFESGKWEKNCKLKYQNYRCKGENCKRRVRTMCICNPGIWMCNECHTQHVLDGIEEDSMWYLIQYSKNRIICDFKCGLNYVYLLVWANYFLSDLFIVMYRCVLYIWLCSRVQFWQSYDVVYPVLISVFRVIY